MIKKLQGRCPETIINAASNSCHEWQFFNYLTIQSQTGNDSEQQKDNFYIITAVTAATSLH